MNNTKLLDDVKRKIISIKNNATIFYEEHKAETIEGAALIATTSLSLYLGIKINENDRLLKECGNKVNYLTKEINQLSKQMKIKDSIIQYNNKRIWFLKDLCERKDGIMCSVISDGLRHGSPLCAQQMGYKAHLKS